MVNIGVMMLVTASMLDQTVLAVSSKDKCIKVTPDSNAAGVKHDWYYPEGYGKTCGSTMEPGSFACTQVKDPANSSRMLEHKFDRYSKGYNNKMDSVAWCTAKWCLVDPCKCNNSDMAASSWYKGYYSYSMCGATDTYTPAACGSMIKATCDSNPTCKWDTTCKPRTFSEMMTAKRTAAGCASAAANVTGCACLGSHTETVVACPTTRDWLWGIAPSTSKNASGSSKASIASTSTTTVPMNLVQVAQATPSLSTLVSALTAAEMVPLLNALGGSFTIFAPTNAAFVTFNASGALTNLLKPENKNKLVALLKHHAVGSKVMAASLKDFVNITTLQNQKIMGSQQGGQTKVNDATVVVADMMATNGVIHIIDKVIEPSEFYYGVSSTLKGESGNVNKGVTTSAKSSNTVAKSSNGTNKKTNMSVSSSTVKTTGIATAVAVALGLRAIQ